MFCPKSSSPVSQVVGADWFFAYQLYDAPDEPVAASAPDAYDFYVPSTQAPVPAITPTQASTPCDLTGFVASAYLIVGSNPPLQVTTDAQASDNLLSAGQFRIIVPHVLTSALPTDQFGPCTKCRLHVTLTDPRGFIETVEIVHITVITP